MFDRIFKIPFKFRLIVEVLIIVLIGGAYYYFYYTPKIEEIDKLAREYDSLAIKISQLKPIELSYDQFKKEVGLLEEQFQMVLKILPNEKNFNVLYDEVVGLAEKSGVKVTLFQPGGESRVDEFHSRVNFNMNFQTTYVELINYLYRLNYLDKIIDINSFSLSPQKDKDGTLILNVKASLNSYRFNVPGGGK
ncbi:MAG: type pilus assembly protein PilO [Deferribacteres bacterium]|nr:type pilus assembly protein PilO [Deferribacteres bacterium]